MTITKIAELANVSPSTVSNVLNGKANVGAKTREKILRICRETGYYVRNDSIFNKEVSNLIMFHFSDFDRSFYLDILKGINACLIDNEYSLIVCTRESAPLFMDSKLCKGVISLDNSVEDRYFKEKATANLPIVVMDRLLEEEWIRNVITDNYPIMTSFVEALLTKGYREFAFLCGLDTLDNNERFTAFSQVLKGHNVAFDNDNVFYGDFKEESGYQAAKLMILSGNVPEILVCANDNMAKGAINAFRESGLKVPEDVAVTGFDDSLISRSSEITTVAIPRYESGYIAAKTLISLIEGNSLAKSIKIKPEVKWRKTTR